MNSKTISQYQQVLKIIDKNKGDDYTSMLLLAIVEEVGEMARAYLAMKGRKPKNKRAQEDESYKQEMGDVVVAIMKLANLRNINLDDRIAYTLRKIKNRKELLKALSD